MASSLPKEPCSVVTPNYPKWRHCIQNIFLATPFHVNFIQFKKKFQRVIWHRELENLVHFIGLLFHYSFKDVKQQLYKKKTLLFFNEKVCLKSTDTDQLSPPSTVFKPTVGFKLRPSLGSAFQPLQPIVLTVTPTSTPIHDEIDTAISTESGDANISET